MEDAISNDRRDSEEVKENSTNPTLPPNLYRSGNSFQRTEGIKLLDEQKNSFKEGVSPRQRYLDIGCGTGELTREILLNHGNDTSNVVGVDISPEMIDYARRYSHHPCITYDVLDIGTGDLSSFVNKHGTFDRMYSFLCLNWVSDKDRAFRNIATLLKDDGQFLLAFLVKTDLQAVWLHFAESPQWKAYTEGMKHFISSHGTFETKDAAEEYVRRALHQAGLAPKTCHVYTRQVDFDTKQSLMDMMLPLIPFVHAEMPDEQKEDFYNELYGVLYKSLSQGGSNFRFNIDICVAQGSKA